MANSKDTLFKSKVNNYISERATTTPIFAVTNDGNGNYTVGKLNGDVTLTLLNGNYIFTPTRGDAVIISAASVTSIVVDFITLNANALALDGETVTGSGIVNLDPFSSMPDVNLAGVQTAVLSANIIGDPQAPTQIYTLEIGAPTIGRIINITSGEVTLDETLTIPQTTYFVVEAGATLTLTQTQADGATIDTQGTLITTFTDPLDSYNTSLWYAADGWGNGGVFINDWEDSQVSFTNGIMSIALQEVDGNLVSGEYRSNEEYGYGYYEVSMKASTVAGVINGFFTYTGPSEGTPHDEIDVEIKGDDTTKIQVNYWTDGVEHPTTIDLGFDASAGFHTYGFLWEADKIEWYVDGVKIHTETGTRGALPTHPGKIITNLWGTTGAIPWSSDYTIENGEATLEVDSITFAQSVPVTADTTPPAIIDPTAFTFTDTGSSTTDGITSSGTINLTLATDTVSWQYSTNGGTTWIDGVDTSFTLSEGTYDKQNIQVKQFDATGNSSISAMSTVVTSNMVQLEAIGNTLGYDRAPQITELSDGTFAVIFYGYEAEGNSSIFVQKFNADGTTLGSMIKIEALGNDTGGDFYPQITALAGGAFAVSFHGIDSNGDFSVFVQKFDSSGVTASTMVQLEAIDRLDADDYYSKITALADGTFAVTFHGVDTAADGAEDYSIFVQKFNVDGTTFGSMVQLEASSVTVGGDYDPQIVSVGTTGEFVVAFEGLDTLGDYSIFVQKFNADGTTTNNTMVQLEADGYTTGNDYDPQITALANGAFAVVFTGYESASIDSSIFVQRFNADGTINGAMVKLEASDNTAGIDAKPQITTLSDGSFVIAFKGKDAQGDDSQFVQKFDSAGALVGSTVKLEAIGNTTGGDYSPSITSIGTIGEYIVAFSGYESEGDDSIFVQRFNTDGTTNGSMVKLEALNQDYCNDEMPEIVSIGTNGEYVVTFYGGDADDDDSVFVQRFNADGTIIANPTNTLKIDTTIVTPTSIAAATSNGASPVLIGNAETGSAVTIDIAGATYTTTAICGKWSLDTSTATPTSGTLSIANGGVYTLTVNAVDLAGNASTQATGTLGIFNATTDISSDTTSYVNVTNFLVTSNQTLTLTAAQADLTPVSGAGNVVVTGAVGDNVLYILTSGTNSITGGTGSDTINLGEAAANGGVDTMIIATGDSITAAPDQIVYFELDKDKLDLPSVAIASSATVGTASTAENITVNSITIGQIIITSGIATFQAADDITEVLITSVDALSAALGYLAGAIADTETVAFTYDLGSGNSGTYLFQGGANDTDIVVDLVGISVTGGDLTAILA